MEALPYFSPALHIQEVLRMSSPYVGEVRLVGYTFAPVEWNFCDGSLQSISGNPALFQLIGTIYGGDGQTTFALPDLRGRVPIHQGTLSGGSSYVIGQRAGAESVTLSLSQIPAHNHSFLGNSSSQGAVNSPNNATVCAGKEVYKGSTPGAAMNSSILSSAGGSQPHENRQPFLAMNWVISLFGVYPTQG
jgi:microcystin-dependent protein